MMNKIYKIHIEQDPETKLWIAEVPVLEPCISYGESIAEAMEMIQEAIEVKIESMVANGDQIPDDGREYENNRKPFEITMPVRYNQHLVTA